MRGKIRVGFSVAFLSEKGYAPDYAECTSPLSIGMQAFLKRSDAEIVLAAEKLKTPHLEWRIVEIWRER